MLEQIVQTAREKMDEMELKESKDSHNLTVKNNTHNKVKSESEGESGKKESGEKDKKKKEKNPFWENMSQVCHFTIFKISTFKT